MTATTTNTIQTALLELIERARNEQQAWIGSLSDAELNASAGEHKWTAKDDLIHSLFWKRISVERLAVGRSGKTPDNYDDYQPINERVYAERHDWTWERVMQEADETHTLMRDEILALDDAALTDSNLYAWLDGRPPMSTILGNGYLHPLEHIATFYQNRGEAERAADIFAQGAQAEQLSLFPRDKAVALYNAACFFATHGQPDRAVPLLGPSYKLSPDLIEWSKQDTDLDSLRDRADFKALYKE